jgi:hypothetical protein
MTDGRGLRRYGVGVALAVILPVLAAAACDNASEESRDGDRTVAIGPGSAETPPVARAAPRDAVEPRWARRVPAAVAPQAPVDAASTWSGRRGLPAARGASMPPGAPARGTYLGTAEVELAYYDRCIDGTARFSRTGRYEMDAEVAIGPPAEADGLKERSPFNLLVGAGRSVEGETSVWSATVMFDNNALLDYWDIDLRGRTFAGVLAHRHLVSGTNYVKTEQLLVTCQPQFPTTALADEMALGAELAGRSSGDEIELVVVGRTVDEEVRFRLQVEAELRD